MDYLDLTRNKSENNGENFQNDKKWTRHMTTMIADVASYIT